MLIVRPKKQSKTKLTSLTAMPSTRKLPSQVLRAALTRQARPFTRYLTRLSA